MLTNLDIKKLKSIFATKEDLKEIRSDLNGFATKKDLDRFATKKDLDRFVTKEEFLTSFDALMHELKAIREELTLGSYRRLENSDLLENHEERITIVEKKLSF